MHLSAFLPLAALIPHAYAWGAVGHEVVATIAQMHLHPTVMPKLCAILDFNPVDCHLSRVAAWADRVRVQPKYRWTGPLHYINAVDDYPSATCAFPGPEGWNGRTHINVMNAIRNTTTVLQEFEGARRAGVLDEGEDEDVPRYVQDALKFLIHFVGDMHQPLHLTGRNRGGNGDKVAFDGRTTNLHSVWDSLLISERLRTIPRNYTHPLPLPDVEDHLRDTIYDAYIRRIVWEGLLGKWQDELEGWLDCPASDFGVVDAGVSREYQLASTYASVFGSTWQSILSFCMSGFKGNGNGGDENEQGGGLGVDDATLCPYAWAKPIHQLNCDIVYPKELDFAPLNRHGSHAEEEECTCGAADTDASANAYETLLARKRKSHYLELYTPNYAGVIKEQWIVEKLLTQAGIRLAGVLNWIFADLDENVVLIEKRYLSL